jgi:multidrug efflux pump
VNLSAPFSERPVATTLLTLAIALAGFLTYFNLPVAPLPQVACTTGFASMPGEPRDNGSHSCDRPGQISGAATGAGRGCCESRR